MLFYVIEIHILKNILLKYIMQNNQIILNDLKVGNRQVCNFGRDSYTFRVDVCDKENNNEVVATKQILS